MADNTAIDQRRIRAARSQTMFREVNERIVELSQNWPSEPQFICECEDTRCVATITVTAAEYEAVRSDPGSFIVATGHEVPAVVTIVSRTDRYVVVRKLGAGHTLAV